MKVETSDSYGIKLSGLDEEKGGTFGFDEELASLGPRHLKLLEREWAAGLPEDGAAHVAGPARHVVPRGGGGVGPRRCRGGEGAAEERAADPAEEGAGGGSGHGHGLGSTNSAAAVKQLLTTPSSLLLQVCSRRRFYLTFDGRLFVTTSNLFVYIYL